MPANVDPPVDGFQCPDCHKPTLRQLAAKQGTLVDVCFDCHGIWLDHGEIYDFTPEPREWSRRLEAGLDDLRAGARRCPRCGASLADGKLPATRVAASACSRCGGIWFTSAAVSALAGENVQIDIPEEEMAADEELRESARERLRQVAAGMLALPSLFLRSALTLAFLYGILALVLITLVQMGYFTANLALALGVLFAVLQYALGPWIMDLVLRFLYKSRWVEPGELPEHLTRFVARVCDEHKMKFPSFGVIDDGAPTAFTYGHTPNNARVVISRGILELLEPAEVEAVVAHELGHAHNWDMALMTLANLVPLLLYYLYRTAIDLGGGKDKGKSYGALVAVGAYVLYIVSEYIVLWFSRTREYFADRFAGEATGNPNALAGALVKIAYGLAAQGKPAEEDGEEKDKKKTQAADRYGALGALNIFDQKAATALVMASSSGVDGGQGGLDVERIKSAMQWDLWNPWAKWYELHSTHPLVAKRIQYLADQAAHQDQEPLVVFDRRQPESYWDDFAFEMVINLLPFLSFLGGVAGFFLTFAFAPHALLGRSALLWFTVGILLAGLASLVKTRFVYRSDFFTPTSVAALLHRVKVSAVRPVPAQLTGTIIGKGVPGLIWSEDFVLKDKTGIMFLDYRQPLGLWNWLFGLFRAGAYQGKEVRVTGWYRRAPVPYLELFHLEVLDGSLPNRNTYSYYAQLGLGILLMAVGLVLSVLVFKG